MHHTAQRISFSLGASNIAIGDTASFGSPQIYSCIGIDTSANGKNIYRWRSHCRKCGAAFDTSSGVLLSGINRHCPAHHAHIAASEEQAPARKITQDDWDNMTNLEKISYAHGKEKGRALFDKRHAFMVENEAWRKSDYKAYREALMTFDAIHEISLALPSI